jgi:hypothetical protein
MKDPTLGEPDKWQRAHNRASRRKLGIVRSRTRGAIRRKIRRARQQPLPWKPAPTPNEGNE